MLAFARSARNAAAERQTREERLLHRVLGEPVVAQDAEGEAVGDPPDAVVELGERGLVAACDEGDERLVGEVRVPAQRQVDPGGLGQSDGSDVDEHGPGSPRGAPPVHRRSEPIRAGTANNAADPADHLRKEHDDAKEHREPRRCAALATSAALAAAVDARPRERNRVEPPGGAAHRGRSLGGPDGRLRVPEPGQAEHRHASWRT